jgi:hypothetical protein
MAASKSASGGVPGAMCGTEIHRSGRRLLSAFRTSNFTLFRTSHFVLLPEKLFKLRAQSIDFAIVSGGFWH